MKLYRLLVKSEWRLLLRSPQTLLMLLLLPLLLVIIFAFAYRSGQRKAAIGAIDLAQNNVSQSMIDGIDHSPYFKIKKIKSTAYAKEFENEQVQIILKIPADFKGYSCPTQNTLQKINDATNPAVPQILSRILSQAILASNPQSQSTVSRQVGLHIQFMYNPTLSTVPRFVPGSASIIAMIICAMICSSVIVKEKEEGTIKWITLGNVPVIPYLFAKITPYAVISLGELCIILLCVQYYFGLTLGLKLILVLIESVLFVLCSCSFGLFVAALTSTQLAALISSLMGMVILSLLFTGFLFPLENLPYGLKWLPFLVPSYWYYKMVEGTLFRGAGFRQVIGGLLILSSMTITVTYFSIKMFRKNLQ